MRALMKILLVTCLLAAATPAAARTGFSAGTGLMALTNATRQGGDGAQGSTFLTETSALWHDGWYAVGLYFQYDKQGANEVDTAAGPRLELTLDPFFVAVEYAPMMNRSFTDRSIAEQKGSGFGLDLGARFGVAGGTDDQGLFLFGAYNYRVQTVKTQDGAALGETITQTDGYPLFGLGLGF